MKSTHKNRSSSKYRIGIILIAIGILFLGFNFGWFSTSLKKLVFTWQTLLIIIGIIQLFHRKIISGILFTVIGFFFLFPKITILFPVYFRPIASNYFQTYWPVLLIFCGIIILLYRFIKPSKKKKKKSFNDNTSFQTQSINTNDNFSRNIVFGDGEYIVLSEYFNNGDLQVIFGNMRLDLRNTILKEQTTCINMNCVFGSVILLIPEDWFIEFQLETVFSEVKDKRILERFQDNAGKKLIISGSIVFGNLEIKYI